MPILDSNIKFIVHQFQNNTSDFWFDDKNSIIYYVILYTTKIL